MPDWLQILITIIFSLAFITAIAYSGYLLYKRANKAGVCSFISLGPNSHNTIVSADPVSNLVQTGYISCAEGGPAWHPEQITVVNLGPGSFYIMMPNHPTQKLDPSNTAIIDIGSTMILPTVYYDSNSQYTVPNFDISAI